MRKFLFLMISILFGQFAFAQKPVIIKLNSEKQRFEVNSLKSSGFLIENSISELKLNPVTLNKENFISIEVDGLAKIFTEGIPNIPVISKLIEVPFDADVEFVVKSFDEQIIKLSDYGITDKIQPALQSMSKSGKEVPFVFNKEVYNSNDYVDQTIAVYEESGVMRYVRLGRIQIQPIQYNPVKNTLRILNNLVIEVVFKNADFAKTSELQNRFQSSYVDNMLPFTVINHQPVAKNLITQTPVEYVIVSDRMFEAQLEPFIAWKTKKGFHVTVAYTDVIGTTTTAIKSYLQGLYNGATPPSFVLLVGDIAQIPAYTGSHYSDLYYFEYTGDLIPEVFYGRFSANNTTELQPQIDKTLEYEQYLMPDPSYLANNILVAGVDGGYAPTYGNGAINYASTYYCNNDHGINPLTYLYPPATNSTVMQSSQSGASASIISYVNAGVGLYNYTAHGSETSFSDPSFTVSNVHALTNNHKYGLLIGNCCLTNSFQVTECFGESLLRKAGGGTIGYIGASNSTYWDEDYWWAIGYKNTAVSANPTYEQTTTGAYDALFHDKVNEIDPSSWYITQDQMNVCGNLAVQASTSSRKQYYWEIYHLMGDPSLMTYMGVPAAMTVTPSPATLMIGMTSLNVSSAPYSYVALSQAGVLVAAALSDENGNASLTFKAEDLSVGTADLVVTGQNKIPYIGTITISPANQPYIVLNSFTTDVDPDYGQTVNLNVTLENVAESGSGYDASNVVASIALKDPYVTIVDATASFGTINAGENLLVNNAFQIKIANNVPDQYTFNFNMTIVGNDAKYTWPCTFSIKANAPVIEIGNLTITNDNNADGLLDPGETADINIQATNTGHADVANVIGQISSASPYLFLNSISYGPSVLTVSETGEFVFNVTASSAAVAGTSADIQFIVSGGESNQYTAVENQEIFIGLIPVYIISNQGTVSVCNGTFYDSGGETGNYQNYENYTMTLLPGGSSEEIVVTFTSFSTESGYDYLYIYNGPNTSYPLIGTYHGSTSPGTVVGADGLTFRFTSDISIISTGWSANVSCNNSNLQGGTLSAPISCICIGSSTESITLTNNIGSVTDWEKRLNGGSWTSIGHTETTYSETPTESGTWEYRVEVDNGDAYSSVASIIVSPLSEGGSVTGQSTICEGDYTETLTLSGQIGNVQKWQKQLGEGSWMDITNPGIFYTEIPSQDGSWNYRAVVKSGVCDAADSDAAMVIVNPSAMSGIASTDDKTICTGSSINLSLISYEGAIQWQIMDNETNWSDITNATSDIYTTEALNANTWFRAVVGLGECEDDISNIVPISIYENPVAGFTYTANNQTLTFTNTSTNATSCSWDFGDTYSLNEANPVHTYTASGNYTVVLTAMNEGCLEDEYEQIIAVTFLEVDDLNTNILIKPNPSNGRFIIHSGNYKMTSLSIYSISGQKIYETVPMNTSVEVDLNQIVPGVYFIEIISNNMRINKKIIIQ